MNFKPVISMIIAILLLIPCMATAGDVVIIGNSSITESELSRQDLKNIYLGRKTKWSNNQKIIFVTLDNEDAGDIFLNDYLNMIAVQYAEYWLDKVFTGQASPPRSIATDEEMIRFVARTEGAIGYVSSDKRLDDVKIFTVE